MNPGALPRQATGGSDSQAIGRNRAACRPLSWYPSYVIDTVYTGGRVI